MYDDITKQLVKQGISHEILSDKELQTIELKWKAKFIGKRTAPGLEYYKWHIFSFQKNMKFEGENATAEYKKQYPADIYIFNERLQYGLKCIKPDKVPDIVMRDFRDDIYICHHNMKWTYVIPHEFPGMGPYFSND